jgi:hypothetical protein
VFCQKSSATADKLDLLDCKGVEFFGDEKGSARACQKIMKTKGLQIDVVRGAIRKCMKTNGWRKWVSSG